jgi:hypothetical protein
MKIFIFEIVKSFGKRIRVIFMPYFDKKMYAI